MVAMALGFVERHKRQWVDRGLPDYPLWIAALIDSAALLTAVVAVAQRLDRPVFAAAGLMLLALAPWVLELKVMGHAWPAFLVLTAGSVGTLLVVYPVGYEFAPFLLIVMAGHVTAVAGLWKGIVVTAAGEAAVLVAGFSGEMVAQEVAIWATGIVIGLDLGFIMRAQQLRIEAQVREHAVRERQAVLEERQRIAREVHDLVAHSLSVTMLHLTAARREVEDTAAGEGDLGEALAALTEAERVGRRAMADIRGTVGLLGRDGTQDAVAPGLADLPALVAEFRRAGLEVTWEARGADGEVPPATALGLYRVVQESLANVAKHAPGSPCRIRLDLGADPGVLTVTNDLPRAVRRNPGGSGLSGMAARADQLGAAFAAGPRGRSWVVALELPGPA